MQGFAAKYAKEYVEDTVGAAAPVVGEYWADLDWRDSTLGENQDAARQALINYLDAAGGLFSMFDFPTKGILQVRHRARQQPRRPRRRSISFLTTWPRMLS